MQAESHQSVTKRQVFYVPGYDPFHPRRYRELYRKESKSQAAISGYVANLSPKQGGATYGWHVSSEIEGAKVETDVDVLVWSDLVQDSMSRGIVSTYLQLLKTAWIYISSGALFRLMRLRQGPVIAALYPIGVLILQLIVALLLAYGAGSLFAFLHPLLFWLGLGVVWPVLEWFRRKDNKIFAYYLMHDYAYSSQLQGANPPELDERLTEFRKTIEIALDDYNDEVLVVGHSSGAHLAIHVLASILRDRAGIASGKLAFLSLGQVVPMMTFLPKADELRRDLKQLSEQDQVFWLDVTAPGDGCAFALCDPVAVTGIATDKKKCPLVISAAFTQTLSEKRWNELKRRFFRLHFQYLCAFDRPGDYDYFRITAGPKTLAERFDGRAPSKSRKEEPVNKFTSLAP